jgi:hypothetical protein
VLSWAICAANLTLAGFGRDIIDDIFDTYVAYCKFVWNAK